jgi:NitT/TauT family transport system substrate-binding protein
MPGRWLSAAWLILMMMLIGVVQPGHAETDTLRILRPLDVASLPLLIAEHEKLIEKQAEARGLKLSAIRWTPPGKTGPLDSLTGGQADLAVTDIVPFLLAIEAKGDTPQQVRGIAALAQRPYVLVTRNAAIKTIRDFKDKDRIAVPSLKSSGPALMLQMAAAQEWGPENYGKLDPLMVARSDEAATQAVESGKGDITSHFSRSPYSDDELADPKIHRVMDSFDIAGSHSASVLAATARFHDDNPGLCAAVLAALAEANKLIKDNPGHAAEIYVGMEKDHDIALEDLSDMIGDPDLAYTTAPAGIMRIAEFLYRTGRLKRAPQSWKDWFFSEAQDLAGN